MYSLEKWDQVVHKTVVASNIKIEYQVETTSTNRKEAKLLKKKKIRKGEGVLVGSERETLSYL